MESNKPAKDTASALEAQPVSNMPQQPPKEILVTDLATLYKIFIAQHKIDPRKISPHHAKAMRKAHAYGMAQLLTMLRDHFGSMARGQRDEILNGLMNDCIAIEESN